MQKIFAHRGASAYAPENTLEAFDLAVSQGAHGVELDVYLSKDGVPVVAHDETIDRVSNGHGRISDMTVAELKQYQYANGMAQYSHATIPTLQEVFALLAPTALDINVELKPDSTAQGGIEAACLQVAREMGMSSRILYSSFHQESLLRVKQIDGAAVCGFLYSGQLNVPWDYVLSLGLDAIHPQYQALFTPGFVEAAHNKNLLVNPWTVDREEDIRRVLLTGADIVITNYPDRALAIARSL